jgi:predicted phage tail protein
MKRHVLLAALLLASMIATTFAQTPIWRVEFSPSPDHAAVDNAGTPLVTKYEFAVTNGTTVVRQDLGKPTCAPLCTVDINATIVPLPAGTYTATVTAIGPGGSNTSAASAPFTLAGPMRAPGAPGAIRVYRSQ